MLYYKAHKNLREGIQGECTRIVVYSELGDPVAVVAQIGEDTYITSNIGSPEFDSILKEFSIDKLNIKDGK